MRLRDVAKIELGALTKQQYGTFNGKPAAFQTPGSYVNDFSRFGRQWKVFVQADAAVRTSPEDIKRFYVSSNKGEMMPLSSFVTVRPVTGPEYTVRYNLYRSVEIQGANAAGGSSTRVPRAHVAALRQQRG